jgi:hypothetical protein
MQVLWCSAPSSLGLSYTSGPFRNDLSRAENKTHQDALSILDLFFLKSMMLVLVFECSSITLCSIHDTKTFLVEHTQTHTQII